jgi:hypothetical protein
MDGRNGTLKKIFYKDMKSHKMTKFCIEWFSFCPNLTSKFSTTVLFKSFVKQNNLSNKTCIHVHEYLLFQTWFTWVQWFVSCLYKTKYLLQLSTALQIHILGFSQKMIFEKQVILWRSISIQNFMVPCWMVQVLNPSQKFECVIFKRVKVWD